MFKCPTCGNDKSWKICLDKWHDQDIRVDLAKLEQQRVQDNYLNGLIAAHNMAGRFCR